MFQIPTNAECVQFTTDSDLSSSVCLPQSHRHTPSHICFHYMMTSTTPVSVSNVHSLLSLNPLARESICSHTLKLLCIIRCGEVYLTKNPPDPALFIDKNTVHGNSNLPETELKTNSCHSCLELSSRSENLPISVGCSRRGADENDEPASGLCICGTAGYGCTIIIVLDDL